MAISIKSISRLIGRTGVGLAAVTLLTCGTAAAEMAAMPATATLSGKVTAPSEFKAAKVLARHIDKNIVYMVYTQGGSYNAVQMFPGKYEVWVEQLGLDAPRQEVTLAAGKSGTADFKLQPGEIKQVVEGRNTGASAARSASAPIVPYDVLYPEEPIRPVIEKTCLACHGRAFMGFQQKDEAGWTATIGVMMATRIPTGAVNDEQHREIIKYFAKHFGPNAGDRRIQADVEIPLDEAALGKAQYVEYILPKNEKRPTRNVQEVHIDFEGNIWYTERTQPNAIGRLDPRTGKVDEFELPNPKGDPHGMTIDHEGYVYWAEVRGGHLGRLDPKTGKMERFPYDKTGKEGFLGGHTPVAAPNGDVWFTIIYGDALGKWDRKTQEISIWRAPRKRSMPYGMDLSPNGTPVFAQMYGCSVAALDMKLNKIVEYPTLSAPPCVVRRLSVAADNTVWYGVFGKGRLGRLDLKSGKQHEYEMESHLSEPYDVWRDRKRNLVWISDSAQGGALVSFDIGKEKFTYYPSPRSTDFPKTDISSEGHIWYGTRAIRVDTGIGVLIPDKTNLKSLVPTRDGV